MALRHYIGAILGLIGAGVAVCGLARADELRPDVYRPPAQRAAEGAPPFDAKPMPLPRFSAARFKAEFGRSPATSTAGPRRAAEASGNVRNVPLKWAGRLFFRQPTGLFACTAQFVTQRIVLTAAHCVRNETTGDFYTDFQFFLQYDQERWSRRYKQVRCVTTWNKWVDQRLNRYFYDYAFIVLQEPSLTGNFGVDTSWWGRYPTLTAIGYPAAIEGGSVIQVVSGPVTRFPVPGTGRSVLALDHGVDGFTEGASGGAWIAKYSSSTGRTNYAVSLNSFRIDGVDGVVYGPYFDGSFAELLRYASRGCQM